MADMAFQTLKPKRPATTLAELDGAIRVQLERTGPLNIPRNSGARRTPSKVAMLAAIENSGGRW